MATFKSFDVQGMLHNLEQGNLALLVRKAVAIGALILLILLYLFVEFRGFATATAMDQAQIARNIASGRGFSTQFIRPLAIWQLKHAGKTISPDRFPDFYQAPLGPLINAGPLALVKSSWRFTAPAMIYSGDRIIAASSILLFLLSVVIWYLLGKRLFDHKLSLIACITILATDIMWQFSLSGLPHMLMLLLFSGAMWLTVFAMERREEARVVTFSLCGAALLFGLMTLAHGLAIWIFFGWLLFSLIYFPRRALTALATLVPVFLVTLPWMIRNYSVCGNPFGLSICTAFVGGSTLDEGFLRLFGPAPSIFDAHFLSKLKAGVLSQSAEIFSYLGLNIAAGAFFLALLHPFRSPIVSLFRWCILLMWLGAVMGMGLFGVGGTVSSNQLHVLFLPMFILCGLAFLIVLWSRWEIEIPLLRTLFVSGIVFLCSLPMLITLLGSKNRVLQWPPYVPPIIAAVSDWYGEEEIIASDMPWAVAWYGQRKSLLLPELLTTFTHLSDYRVLGNPITGLYLTPVTGDLRLVSDIYKGAYKEWAFLITRPPQSNRFLLPFYISLPVEGECMLFSDYERWNIPRK